MAFNPSSNKYFDSALQAIQGLAIEEYQLERKKKSAAALIEQLKKSGLVGGATEQDPTMGMKLSMPPAATSGLIPQAAMSMSDGSIGDAMGNKLPSQSTISPNVAAPRKLPLLSPGVAKTKPSPFMINPGKTLEGDVDLIANPDYESPKQKESAKRQAVGVSSRLRTEFLNRPEVKDYTTVKASVNSMDALLKKGLDGTADNKVALDQGLITMYNKLTDPQSVVRESEYARTPGNLPMVNRMKGAIDKLSKGGAGLTDEDRKALVLGAKIIANERGKIYQGTLDEYKGLAGEYDIDESLITRGSDDHTDYSLDDPITAPKSAAKATGVFKKDDLIAEYNRRKKAGLIE
jgi:hypothetical protein